MARDTSLVRHVLTPVANEEDGRRTATALSSYDPEAVTVLFVVEKAGGAPDRLSPAQAQGVAEASFAAFREVMPGAEERIAGGTDVTETIFEIATEVGASSIAFTSRGGGRLVQFLSGDTAIKLVTQNDIPVIALPREP